MHIDSIEQQIRQLEAQDHFSPDDYRFIQQWSQSSDPYVRDMVASLLAGRPSTQSKAVLLHLAHDPDALVRTDAYDSLSEFPCDEVSDLLNHAAVTEPDPLARSYAILSCADIMSPQEAARRCPFFRTIYEAEKSARCKLSCLYALFLCGEERALNHILSYVRHSDYQIRCSAISILQEISDTHNLPNIRSALLDQQAVETSAAVKDRIHEFLEHATSADSL